MIEKFIAWSKYLKIASKDKGWCPLRLFGTQRYFIEEIQKGLAQGKHSFVVLKARQLGITTISLALDLYWLYRYPHLNGELITDSESNRDYFRSILQDYMKSLPRALKYPTTQMNRNQLILKNGSKLLFAIASKKNKGLGQGKGITLLHATEVSTYENEDGFKSLMGSLSDKHPHRLFIFESTAKGFNMFYDLWDAAERASSMHPIFIGWWRKEDYAITNDDIRFSAYCGKPTPEERDWIKQVEKRYDFKITESQLAWYRWKLNEEMLGDEEMMMQEYPTLPEQAFIFSGSKFFDALKLTKAFREIKSIKPSFYQLQVGQTINDLKLVESRNNYNLKIFEEPVEGAYYVVGVDTAYGASEMSDYSTLAIYRIWADRMVQVAEFQDNKLAPHQFAWVIASLCGLYGQNVFLNMEVNGSGYAVLTELRHLKSGYSLVGKLEAPQKNLMNAIKFYIWGRPDSIMGVSSSYHWKTSYSTKRMMMDAMRDLFESGVLEIRSIDLLNEMRYIINDGSSVEAETGKHDDLVIATALACVYFRQHIQPKLYAKNMTYAMDMVKEEEQKKLNNPYYVLIQRAKQQIKSA